MTGAVVGAALLSLIILFDFMDPTSISLLQTKITNTEGVGELYWAGTFDSSVTVSGVKPLSYTRSGNANSNNHTYSNVLPNEQQGIYFDVTLLGGFSSSPTQVAYLGVTNATTPQHISIDNSFVSWYWSGVINYPDDQFENIDSVLNTGKYRIGVRADVTGWDVRFYKFGDSRVRGSYRLGNFINSSQLRLMIMGQNGFPLPIAEIINGPNGVGVFKGGGGLF